MDNKTSQVAIPDVSNMSVVNAIKELQEAGFEVNDTQVEKRSSTILEGNVITTSPAPGLKRKKDLLFNYMYQLVRKKLK